MIIHLGTQILPEFGYVTDGRKVERIRPNIGGRPIVLEEFSAEAFVKLHAELEAWRVQEEAKREKPEDGQ